MTGKPKRAAIVNITDMGMAGLDAFVDERLYHYNTQATGVTGGLALVGAIRNASGQVLGAVSGHTWGGTCEILRLWVHDAHRRQGLGTALIEAAEREARRRGCAQVCLSTHTFQAPRFYERRGYRCVGSIEDYPPGHAKRFYVKRLDDDREAGTV
jgi:ribosomal protein S18 acetylase RimI-like enzyme